MSYSYDDDDDDFGNDPNANSPLVKQLRKQLKEAQKRVTDAEDRAAKHEKVVRNRTVADVLKDRGANPALARFVLQDVEDPTPESVASWLTDNGSLFGVKPPAADPAQLLGLPAGTELPPDLASAYQKFIETQSGGTRPDPAAASLEAKLNDPNLTQSELLALIASGP